MVTNSSAAEAAPVIPPSSGISSMTEMAVSPTSVASSGHFPFTASDMAGMGIDTCTLDATFTSDVANSVGLQLGHDGDAGSSRPMDQIWNFSLSDLTADLSNLGGNLQIELLSFSLYGYGKVAMLFHYNLYKARYLKS